MIILLSPAKSLNLEQENYAFTPTQARFRKRALELVDTMKSFSADDLKKLMHISDELAELNRNRFKNFKKIHNQVNSKPAVLCFSGDVYRGLKADTFTKKDMTFAQSHLRILSGLYGLLKPMDLIQAYRLEMGTKINTENISTLYKFWGEAITKAINADMKATKSQTIINLASKEYFSAVKKKKLNGEVIDIHFREWRDDQLKFISFNAPPCHPLPSQARPLVPAGHGPLW